MNCKIFRIDGFKEYAWCEAHKKFELIKDMKKNGGK